MVLSPGSSEATLVFVAFLMGFVFAVSAFVVFVLAGFNLTSFLRAGFFCATGFFSGWSSTISLVLGARACGNGSAGAAT